jgi:branched-chain amino acid transport system permease protein
MYVIYAGVALPQSFDAIVGLTWFAVLITNGRRSNNAALAAGLSITLIPQLFSTYLPTSLGPLPTLLFGAGAVLLARNPDGIITMNGRQITSLARRLGGRGRHPGGERPDPADPAASRMPTPAGAMQSPSGTVKSPAGAVKSPAAAVKMEDAQ